jgi:predicted MFS family arabinose efflux permease
VTANLREHKQFGQADRMHESLDTIVTPLHVGQRLRLLVAAFLAWMFAGLNISLFVLIHRQMTLELLGADTPERVVTQWFAWYQAAFLLGAATGGWLFGWLGDRFGRTRSLALSVLCLTGFTAACYLNRQASTMLVLRYLACLGIGGVWPNAVALVAEAWPNGSRPMLAGLLGTAANVGFVLLGVLGYYVPITQEAWRWTLLVGGSPAVLSVLILCCVPESPRWLAGRTRQRSSDRRESPLREVLRPPLVSRTVLGVLLGAVPVVGSAANANWLVPWTDHAQQLKLQTAGLDPASATAPVRSASTVNHSPVSPRRPDARQKAKTQIVRSGGAVVGSLLGGIMASLLGRRLSYFLISLGSMGMSTYIFSQLDPLRASFPYAAFALGFIGTTYFGWLPLFLPELFPTRVRSTGTGISFNTGRIVSAMVVLSAGMLLDQFGGDYARVGLWTGLIYAVGMVIIWWVPSGRSTRLED